MRTSILILAVLTPLCFVCGITCAYENDYPIPEWGYNHGSIMFQNQNPECIVIEMENITSRTLENQNYEWNIITDPTADIWMTVSTGDVVAGLITNRGANPAVLFDQTASLGENESIEIATIPPGKSLNFTCCWCVFKNLEDG